ncbi:hypothetical protein BKP57_04115 [Virgibacillus sp. 6R]|nr:hypothetical protein BKP57_04115 [Virgibacillus sp. 6R]
MQLTYRKKTQGEISSHILDGLYVFLIRFRIALFMINFYMGEKQGTQGVEYFPHIFSQLLITS